jgi:hypothetical protein
MNVFYFLADLANELDNNQAHRWADKTYEVMTRMASGESMNIFEEIFETDDNTKTASDKNKGKKLNKPFRTPGGPKKFSVYVKNDKGNIVKVNFGDPGLSIKRSNPNRRKNFRARHNCDSPGPRTKARYWSCRNWEAGRSVSDNLKGK